MTLSRLATEQTDHGRARLVMSRRSLWVFGFSGLLMATLSGCVVGSDDEDPPPALGEQDDGEPDTSISGHPVLGPVVWTTAVTPGTNEPVAEVFSFPIDTPVIFAAFPVERIARGIVIRASWTFNGEAVDGVGAQLESTRDQVGGWIEFHLERMSEDPWPDGDYGISLTTENILIATGSVQVVRLTV